MLPLLWNIFISLRSGKPAGDDPWEGNTLEWATSSPPPPYNFDHLPAIRSERPVFDAAPRRDRGPRRARPMTVDSHALATTEVQHNPVEGYAHDAQGGMSNVILGMLLFITSEVMFFAGLFAAYFNARANAPQWPPVNPETSEAFHLAILPFVGPATVLLILSLVHLPVRRVGHPARRPHGASCATSRSPSSSASSSCSCRSSTTRSWRARASPSSAGTFGTTYFTLTGFHGAHVFGGAIMLGVVLYRGMAGQFSAKHHDAVEAASLYWHFVDVVWILLFSLLYLLPGNAPH